MSPDALHTAHASLVAALRALRNADGGWPYYVGRRSRLEPTSWAMLALGERVETTPLRSWAGPDGLLVEPATGQVNYAFNGLAALATAATSAELRPLAARILEALIKVRGEAVQASPVIKQDTSLQGWSWTPGTISWIEPTSWCMLALKRWRPRDSAAKARIEVGEKILRDRVCNGGGWNFGNGEVYGTALPAHVPPTAIGVLAMQDHPTDALVTDAVGFLERRAAAEGSSTAVSMAMLALSVVGRSSEALVNKLVSQLPTALMLGNAAPLGIAAYAIDSWRTGPPVAFKLGKG